MDWEQTVCATAGRLPGQAARGATAPIWVPVPTPRAAEVSNWSAAIPGLSHGRHFSKPITLSADSDGESNGGDFSSSGRIRSDAASCTVTVWVMLWQPQLWARQEGTQLPKGVTWCPQPAPRAAQVLVGSWGGLHIGPMQCLSTVGEAAPWEYPLLNEGWIWGNQPEWNSDGEVHGAQITARSSWEEPRLSSAAGTSAERGPGSARSCRPGEDQARGAYGLRAEAFHPEH